VVALNFLLTKDENFSEIKFALFSLRFSKFKLYTWNHMVSVICKRFLGNSDAIELSLLRIF